MKKLFVLTLALGLALSGCGKEPAPATETAAMPSAAAAETTAASTAATVQTTAAATDPTVPPITNALTGEVLEKENDSRLVGVMINNSSAAMPQCGIGHADVIFEILAEGSTTRMMALFTDAEHAGTIGPVRSLRPYYLDIMRGYDALCTSAGGSDKADNMIYDMDYDRMNGISGGSASYFYRDSWRADNRGYEHSLFVDGDDLVAGAADLEMRTQRSEGFDAGLKFDSSKLMGGEPAQEIEVEFQYNGKTTDFTYDEALGGYTAYQHGQDYIDGNTQEPVVFENVLILNADIYVYDGGGHLDVQTTGEGSGYYAMDGKMVSIVWSREDEESPYQFATEDGEELILGVGKSYVAVINPDDGSVYYE